MRNSFWAVSGAVLYLITLTLICRVRNNVLQLRGALKHFEDTGEIGNFCADITTVPLTT